MAARVLGRQVTLLVNSSSLVLPIALGKIDQFSANSTTDIVKRRPMGKNLEAANLRYSGYDLSFQIDKRDPMLERWNHLVERGIFGAENQPELFITEITKHYSRVPFTSLPIIECWIYRNVTLFGLDKNSTPDEIQQNIRGFATHKEIGPVDISFMNLQWLPGIGFQEVVHKDAQLQVGNKITDILVGSLLRNI